MILQPGKDCELRLQKLHSYGKLTWIQIQPTAETSAIYKLQLYGLPMNNLLYSPPCEGRETLLPFMDKETQCREIKPPDQDFLANKQQTLDVNVVLSTFISRTCKIIPLCL